MIYESNRNYKINIDIDGPANFVYTKNNLGVISSYDRDPNDSTPFKLSQFYASSYLQSVEIITSTDENGSDSTVKFSQIEFLIKS